MQHWKHIQIIGDQRFFITQTKKISTSMNLFRVAIVAKKKSIMRMLEIINLNRSRYLSNSYSISIWNNGKTHTVEKSQENWIRSSFHERKKCCDCPFDWLASSIELIYLYCIYFVHCSSIRPLQFDLSVLRLKHIIKKISFHCRISAIHFFFFSK